MLKTSSPGRVARNEVSRSESLEKPWRKARVRLEGRLGPPMRAEEGDGSSHIYSPKHRASSLRSALKLCGYRVWYQDKETTEGRGGTRCERRSGGGENQSPSAEQVFHIPEETAAGPAELHQQKKVQEGRTRGRRSNYWTKALKTNRAGHHITSVEVSGAPKKGQQEVPRTMEKENGVRKWSAPATDGPSRNTAQKTRGQGKERRSKGVSPCPGSEDVAADSGSRKSSAPAIARGKDSTMRNKIKRRGDRFYSAGA